MPSLNALKSNFEAAVAQGDRTLQEFQTKLSTNPVHAFKWADNVMYMTARRAVAERFLTFINGWLEASKNGTLEARLPQNEEEMVERIFQNATKQALLSNRYTNQSTSTSSNYMERMEAAYYAELASDWDLIH